MMLSLAEINTDRVGTGWNKNDGAVACWPMARGCL